MGWWNEDYAYDCACYLEGRCMDSVIEDGKQFYPQYEDEDSGED